MTLLDYFNTPETSLPQELIYGQVFLADAPFVSHQRVLFKLAMSLADRRMTACGPDVFMEGYVHGID